VSYVEFAVEHPGHFQVMFAPTLLDETDAALSEARTRAFGELTGGVDRLGLADPGDDAAAAVIAGWSLVHGLATLALTGNLQSSGVRDLLVEQDLAALTRRTASMLFGSVPRQGQRGEQPDQQPPRADLRSTTSG
jgi:hypothetical protein